MLFIHPMWDSEGERIGKQKCTPLGYALHVIADLIGFLGLLMLLILPIVFAWKWLAGAFRAPLFWWIAVPFCIGILSEVIFQFSWWLAYRKSFQYSDEREATWMDRGERRSYRYPG